MNRLIASVSPIALALIASTAFAAVGRTPGSFAVSPTGAATYSIPVWAPPGPRGVQPSLAISYSSHSGGGMLGPGWSVAGLSAITRCEKTVAQDGAPAGVTLTTSDAFCLDGKRLRLTAGTYGQAGSQYQTEIADFSLVTANGTQGNGPASFTVQGKNGWTYEYGNGGNSQIVASGTSTAVAWMLDKVTDRSNNRMTVTYLAPDANLVSSTVPDVISWTASSSGSSSFNYTIKFNYVGNNAQGSTVGYVAGAPVLNADLLASISVNSAATTKKKYVFGYELSPTTGAYRLLQIKECADSGETDCLAPTVITWQNGQAGVVSSPSGSAASAPLYDANGDGFPDLFYVSGGTWYVAFGSASGFGSGVSTGAAAGSGATGSTLGDVLGNGRVGVLSNVSGTWYYYWWNGSAFTSASTGISVDTSANSVVLADGDGDGRADLFWMTFSGGAHLYMRASNGGSASPSFGVIQNPYNRTTGFANGQPLDSASISKPLTSLPFVDINGDGRHDLVMYTSEVASCQYFPPYPFPVCVNFYGAIALVSQANGTYTDMMVGGQAGAASSYVPLFVNWNNDACTDIIYSTVVSISKCNGTASTSIAVSNAIGALDWDGDGRADVVVINGANLGVRLSTGGDVSSTVIDTGIPYSSSTCAQAYTLDVDGDGLDDLGCAGSNIAYYLHNSPNTVPNLVTSITDGYGVVVSPSYVSLSHGVASGVFDATPDAVYPYRDYNGPYYVVGSYTATDGTGVVDGSHNYTTQYRYSRAWMEGAGRGFMGFDSVRSIDSRNPLRSYQYFWRDFPYTGMLKESHVYQSDDSTNVGQALNTRNAQTLDGTTNNQRYFPYVSNSTRKQWELGGTKNGVLVTTASTDFTFDGYGNATTVAETITDNDSTSPYNGLSWTSSTVTTISPQTSNWCLNLPTGISVTRTAPGGAVTSSIVRTATFAADYANCRASQKTTSGGTYAVVQDLGYDSFGNLNSVTTTGYSMSARTSGVDWGTTGQLPASSTNALGQQTLYGYDAGLGLLTSVTDPNGVVTSSQYDTFGRQIRENRADGTATTWAFANCASCVDAANVLSVTETVLNVGGTTQTDSVVYLDRYDRTLTKRNRLLDGSYNRVDTQYDSLGRVSGQAAPCTWGSCTYYWTISSYDALNRTIRIQRPINEPNSSNLRTTTIQYAGRTTTTTDPQGKQTVNVTSVVGTLLRTQDHAGYYQNFVNDAFGSLLSVTDTASNPLFSATYDYGIGAFQRTTNDTDLGQRSYTPNALGEVVAYSDDNSHSFGVSYDALSRPLTRTEPDLVTTYTWGSSAASHNIGQLQSVSATSSAGTYAEALTYDGVGRPVSRTITIPSDSPSTYTYDAAYNGTTGLPDTLTYPADSAGNRLKLQYAYANGILQSASNYNSPGTVFWAANAMNVAAQVTQETLGNGVVTNRTFDAVTGWMSSVHSGLSGGSALQNESYLYDLVGNVTQRQNNNIGLTENFYYDNLYRLEHSTLGANQNLALTYDTTGNILTRTDVASAASWAYGTSRVHAVTQAGSGAYNYSYDANGNVTSRFGSALTWTSYNHPSVINGPGGESIQFAYNQAHQRWRAIYSGNAGVETTYFIGELMEKAVTTAGTDYRHMIQVGGSTVAIYSRTGAGSVTVRYVLEDHEGSVAGIVNADGSSYVKESFTAFGARRNQCTWGGPPTQGTKDKIAAVTRHGYTWHTALADMGLNDMNGRVQDAVTGRFLSPDPYVQFPGNTQSFNRYTYALNNPLTYRDPSGFMLICTTTMQRDYGMENAMRSAVRERRAKTAGEGGMYSDAAVLDVDGDFPAFYTPAVNCIDIPDPVNVPTTPGADPPGAAPGDTRKPGPAKRGASQRRCTSGEHEGMPGQERLADAAAVGSYLLDSNATFAEQALSASMRAGRPASASTAILDPALFPGRVQTPSVYVWRAGQEANSLLLTTGARFTGFLATGIDFSSAVNNMSEGHNEDATLDFISSGLGALMLAQPETSPVALPALGAVKLVPPTTWAINILTCNGTIPVTGGMGP